MRAAVIAIALLTAQAAARADETAMRPEAKAQLDLGLREYAVGKWAEAIAAFRAGYEHDPRPELLYALAQAQRMSGDCAQAAASYRAFLRTSPSEAQARPARQNLDRCEALLEKARAEEARRAQAALPVAEAPRRPWQRDVLGATLLGVGLGVAGVGGALWGVGEAGLADLAASTRYDDFARRAAMADANEIERGVGIGAVALGSALVVAGAIRWAVLARHR